MVTFSELEISVSVVAQYLSQRLAFWTLSGWSTLEGLRLLRVLVTGAAGFIGSSLSQALLAQGHEVVAFDNFSSGRRSNIIHLLKDSKFRLIRGNAESVSDVQRAMRHADITFHFAANPQVRRSKANMKRAFWESVTATYTVVESIVRTRTPRVFFSSSSTVYGEATRYPTPEEYSPLLPISIYGAAKLASEVLMLTYASIHKFDATILRLANVVGPSSRHGIVFDFARKLRNDPSVLVILGDVRQSKSYLHITDCISAILTVLEKTSGSNILNVGSEDQLSTRSIADIVCEEMKVQPLYRFAGERYQGRGWPGDVTNMLLDVTRLESLGWKPMFNSAQAVRLTARQLFGGGGLSWPQKSLLGRQFV